MQYCGIGPEGGKPLANILFYVESEMEQVLLRGNELGDEGAINLFRGVKRNQKLKVLDVADNKFSEAPDILELLLELFQNNLRRIFFADLNASAKEYVQPLNNFLTH